MALLLEADLGIFFNSQEFSTEAIIQGRRVAGLEGHSTVISNEVETQKTSFTCPSGGILDIAHGMRIHLGDQTYTVVGIQLDGLGLTTLILECVSE